MTNTTSQRPVWRSLAVVASLSLLGVTACAAPSSNAANGQQELLVGSDMTYPPYDYFEGSTPAGLDYELWQLLGPKIGVSASFKDTRFEQLINGLKSGTFEVISSALYITPDRSKQIDFIPYFSTGNSIISQSDSTTPPASTEDLCGLTVSVLKGSDISKKLASDANALCEKAGKSPVDAREFATDPEATQALLSAQVQAQVTDAAVAANIVEKKNTLKITSDELLYPVPVGMAVAKGNTALKERIEKGLEELRTGGEYEDLLKKYNLKPATEEQVNAALGR